MSEKSMDSNTAAVVEVAGSVAMQAMVAQAKEMEVRFFQRLGIDSREEVVIKVKR